MANSCIKIKLLFLLPIDNEEDEDDESFYSNQYCKNTGIKDLQKDFPTNPTFRCLEEYNCNFSTNRSVDYVMHYETVHLHKKLGKAIL